mmetsp:Transcript_4804/g.12792  ORF Transcript_4804/g.12792 Transcript_4804/m.12792 type:complete len:233 (-) Transcript_4804:554-1252(-)
MKPPTEDRIDAGSTILHDTNRTHIRASLAKPTHTSHAVMRARCTEAVRQDPFMLSSCDPSHNGTRPDSATISPPKQFSEWRLIVVGLILFLFGCAALLGCCRRKLLRTAGTLRTASALLLGGGRSLGLHHSFDLLSRLACALICVSRPTITGCRGRSIAVRRRGGGGGSTTLRGLLRLLLGSLCRCLRRAVRLLTISFGTLELSQQAVNLVELRLLLIFLWLLLALRREHDR